ncbi:MAG: hypothetical protein FP825_02320 [Hyphomonas sp.]|uniref:hypothetical protein n=1 Tax=Hyphomonas sp. TaxID=87 RepID=UPI0017A7B77D|nr:hypothetical protein [Hyphomonas sp.]MBA3067300.1 hypothetical protein [Hyphomonas sp.]MBU3919011.1 hypothetical protein [Alphaproteobacteria bacterium]MBU4062989.1 hypothetical protein [Alphaproteobacteria bacterium]MBU4163570.1 hypothetical protein [Alphaproteobacteria bacterium]
MRFGWVLAGALLLAACGQKDGASPGTAASGAGPAGPAGTPAEMPVRPALDYAALSGYDITTWFLSPGWPGEYPPGFAVLDEAVKVPARARPNPTDPQDITCLLPQYANYQLWNNVRTAEDDLEYFVATKKVPVTVLEDTEIEFVGDAGIETLALKKGDVLTYLRYIGEGFTVLSFNGREFDINEGELSNVTDIGAASLEEDLWVRVSCLGGKQGWLMFDEVIEEPGVFPSPITGYGDAADILPGDADAVREAITTDAYGVNASEQEIIPPSEE